MPKIPEFFNTQNITPVDRGGNAWENAARRIPGFYNAAASNEREGGRADAQAFKQLLWPFDIQELYDRRAARAAADVAPARKSPTLKVVGDIAPLETAERRNQRAGTTAGTMQIAAGAGALGDMLSDGGAQAAQREPSGQRQPAGQRGLSSQRGPGAARQGGRDDGYTIEQGELISMSEARKSMTKYNADRDERVQGWTNDLVNTQNYWDRYYGIDQNGNTGGAYVDAGPASQSRFQPEPQGWLSSTASSVGSAVGSGLSAVESLFVPGAREIDSWFSGSAPAATAPIPNE